MGLLSRGESWLTTKTLTAGGVSVTYTRSPKVATLTVVPGDQQIAAVRLGQVPQAVSSTMERDYLVSVAALAAAGFSGPPQVGDRITETINGEDVTFELMRQDGGRPCWAWSGTGRSMYRVHAKRVP